MGPLGSGIVALSISSCETLGKMLGARALERGPRLQESLTPIYFTASTLGRHLVTSCVLRKTNKPPTAPLLQAALLAPPATTLPLGVGGRRSEYAA